MVQSIQLIQMLLVWQDERQAIEYGCTKACIGETSHDLNTRAIGAIAKWGKHDRVEPSFLQHVLGVRRSVVGHIKQCQTHLYLVLFCMFFFLVDLCSRTWYDSPVQAVDGQDLVAHACLFHVRLCCLLPILWEVGCKPCLSLVNLLFQVIYPRSSPLSGRTHFAIAGPFRPLFLLFPCPFKGTRLPLCLCSLVLVSILILFLFLLSSFRIKAEVVKVVVSLFSFSQRCFQIGSLLLSFSFSCFVFWVFFFFPFSLTTFSLFHVTFYTQPYQK